MFMRMYTHVILAVAAIRTVIFLFGGDISFFIVLGWVLPSYCLLHYMGVFTKEKRKTTT